MSGLVTLTTDYGGRDGFTGALKGVLLSAAPDLRIVDLVHELTPHDALAGAVAVLTACRTFPPGTVHLVVVDPDVGTSRAGLVVEAWNQWFVGPDSGVLHFALRHPRARVFALDPSLRRPAPGGTTTFDGRDWFAPAAAHLAAGGEISAIAAPTDDVALLQIPAPSHEPFRWLGHILHVDGFGNLVSNLPARSGAARSTARVFLGEEPIGGIRTAYADVIEGHAVATIGALGTIEIGLCRGRAVDRFGVRRGARIEVLFPNEQAVPTPPWYAEPASDADPL